MNLLSILSWFSFIIDFSFDGTDVSMFELGGLHQSDFSRLDQLHHQEGSLPIHNFYL